MPKGEIYAVEISAVMMKELVKLADVRENIVPILADARRPREYAEIGTIDVLYQDVAQPDQAEIFVKNAEMFLKNGGYAYFCVKSQSVDVLKEPKKVFDEVVAYLKRAGFCIEERLTLEPYDKAHEFLVIRK
jgi:fibrillarin-like pre-rRNA processing protein